MSRERQVFRVGSWTVDPMADELRRGETRVKLTPRATDVLWVLAQTPGEVVSINDLLDSVWRGAEVAPGALYQTILHLRNALGDESNAAVRIENVPRRGYRLVGSVSFSGTATGAAGIEARRSGATQAPTPPVSIEPDATVVTSPDRRPARRTGLAMLIACLVIVAIAAWMIPWASLGTSDAPPGGPLSVAVLPFSSSDTAPSVRYLADGLTDELIVTLGQLPALSVTGRTSSFQLRETRASMREIGDRLGVRYVLEGRIESERDLVRINAGLVNTMTGAQIWAQSYQVPRDEFASVQVGIARSVAKSVNLLLSAETSEWLAFRQRRNPQAFDVYLRGRYYWSQRSQQSLAQARTQFERAAALDPNDADAQIALAEVYALLPLYGVAPPSVAFPLAREAAERALRLDPTRGEARATLAVVRYQFDRDWVGAEREFLSSIEASPSYPTAYQWYSEFLSYSGRFVEAETQIARARTLDPISPTIDVLSGSPALWARDYPRAIARFEESIARDGDFALGHYSVGLAQIGARRPREALEFLERSEVGLGQVFVAATLAHAVVAVGDVERARGLRDMLIKLSTQRYVSPYKIAVVHVALEEYADALTQLERAETMGDDRLALIAVDALMDPLRSEPRFKELLNRVGPPIVTTSSPARKSEQSPPP